MSETIEDKKENKPCCVYILQLDLGWFFTDKGERCLPFIKSKDEDVMFRVNYCPSCGKNIRDIMID